MQKYKEKEAAAAQSSPAQAEPANDSPQKTGGISWGTVIAGGGLIVGAAGVYYQREALQKRFQSFVTQKTRPKPATCCRQRACPSA